MTRKIKKEKSKRKYFGELLTDREIKKHAVKSNFGTQDLEEIYQKELAGHIVNFFMKHSTDLEIPEAMIQNLRITQNQNTFAKYDPRTKLWEFDLSMGSLPIDIIEYIVLEVLCHHYMITNNGEFEEIMSKILVNYKEIENKLKEITSSANDCLSN